MCTTCGCGNGDALIEGKTVGREAGQDGAPQEHSHHHDDGSTAGSQADAPQQAQPGQYRRAADASGAHWHRHSDGTWHSHIHGGGSAHGEQASVIAGARTAGDAQGIAASRIVQIEQDILAKNDALAAVNRRFLGDHGVFALNLVSSPGSGKTTLLVRTIRDWAGRTPLAVIEGDQRTSRDADRVRAAGALAVQINTAKGCHLDAQMVAHALTHLKLSDDSLLLIENVGNLVCPAAFDLGEAHKVAILSVTEGDDKPLKYPDMFHAADLLLINKIDLLPHVEFDVAAAIEYARRVRPGLEVLLVSAQTGAGVAEWLAWLERGVSVARERRQSSVEALRRRVAELEDELARREPTVAPA
ncbi:MAG TPA: hydrogenase nickel incorporation protein HypB [Pseudomonadota bacterium]|nr:hydrogenase nickel incorporation protein HypB [Pseudomonadota bacterium]